MMGRGKLLDEPGYDRLRLSQWSAGQARDDGISRRDLMRLSAGLALAGAPLIGAATPTAAAAVPAAPPLRGTPLPPA
jgi:hypothetical protein